MNQAAVAAEATAFLPSYDPLIPHPQHVRDPYRVYRELRENAPMYRSPHGVWVASRHREVAFMLKDPGFGRGYFYFDNLAKRLGPGIRDQAIYKSSQNMMLMKDGAAHARIRNIVAPAFAAKRVEALRPRMREIMNRLVEDVLRKGSLDVMLDLAFPLPSAVICHMVGVPEGDWPKFRKRSASGSRALEPAPLNPIELAQQNQAVLEFEEYFSWLMDLRARDPGGDLTSALVAAEIDGKKLGRDEIIANLRMMFIGGQETTVNTIGNGLLALYRHPDQLASLRADPSLLAGAVVEMVRYDSSVQITPRQSREPIVVGGADIAAGETILCIVASANRDPEAYREPDRFDISRKNNFPSSFGGGPHYCTGAQLGKVEAEVAIGTTLERFPKLRPDIENPQWLQGTVVFRGLRTLPATF
jgi:cytochrome P450